MFPPKRILFPVDFSPQCDQAARMVETFAGHFQAQLTLLHVLEPPAYNDLLIETAATAEARLKQYLAEELEQFDVKREILEGDAATRISWFAHSHSFDLIMLPTRGYGAFRRLMLGSVTAKVLRSAACPVWTGVHMEQMPRLEDVAFRRIVCAIDLGKQSCATLRWAAAFAAEFGACVHIVHAVPAALEAFPAEGELIHQARTAIQGMQESIGLHAPVSIVPQEVDAAVCECAAREWADLVVIGRGAVVDGLLGRLRANAYSIIRQSPVPVVSV